MARHDSCCPDVVLGTRCCHATTPAAPAFGCSGPAPAEVVVTVDYRDLCTADEMIEDVGKAYAYLATIATAVSGEIVDGLTDPLALDTDRLAGMAQEVANAIRVVETHQRGNDMRPLAPAPTWGVIEEWKEAGCPAVPPNDDTLCCGESRDLRRQNRVVGSED